MGLGKKADEVDNSSGSNGSSSSGGSSNSSNTGNEYPQYKKWFPYAVIYEDMEGDLKFVHMPHNFEFEKIKNTEKSSWTLQHKTQGFHGVPSNVKRYWKDRVELLRADRYVKKVFDTSVLEDNDCPALIRENPERACELISEASNKIRLNGDNNDPHKPQKKTHRNCAVCDKGIDIRYGSYEKVDRRVVCSDHSVKQLRENGLID